VLQACWRCRGQAPIGDQFTMAPAGTDRRTQPTLAIAIKQLPSYRRPIQHLPLVAAVMINILQNRSWEQYLAGEQQCGAHVLRTPSSNWAGRVRDAHAWRRGKISALHTIPLVVFLRMLRCWLPRLWASTAERQGGGTFAQRDPKIPQPPLTRSPRTGSPSLPGIARSVGPLPRANGYADAGAQTHRAGRYSIHRRGITPYANGGPLNGKTRGWGATCTVDARDLHGQSNADHAAARMNQQPTECRAFTTDLRRRGGHLLARVSNIKDFTPDKAPGCSLHMEPGTGQALANRGNAIASTARGRHYH